MPLKPAKKPTSKRKQNGKKTVKGQATKSKQKYELESTPKEQISELDKEILTIKISESESKLNRKRHLCSYLEEEISIYKTLYNEKQLLKSESMKLLNKAFEDFATEIFLLDQECVAMQHTYSKILENQKFCSSYREKVEKLGVLEAKLEENLCESEKCFEELPKLSNTFAELEERATREKEKFNHGKEQILTEFETGILRIQNELNSKIGEAIEDKNLKLDLLPVPYKTLFLSGWLSSSWLDSAVKFYESLQNKNSELEKKYNELLLTSIRDKKYVKKFFSDDEILLLFQLKSDSEVGSSKEVQILPKRKKLVPSDVFKYPKQNQQFLYLEIKNLHLENKIKSMKSEMADLEAAIQSMEVSGETYFEKSYLVQIVYKAGSILKQEL